ncbi:serine hydrolase [Mucilaginibacter ginkgonis]|uniref:beta-lactamase n=1 Tax=Mucilaginibacter ginkgonis TaxID=2682091 RepID=A0A6I4HWJ6_9SPHI|nr:serine hydrolase [Mucilaginibacter ginkgonis]QQL51334.1 serine hydrolase [Mucilaginibacter ginkgonis]
MKYILTLVVTVLSISVFAQTDKRLTSKLQEAVQGYNGDIGIYVHNLKTGKTAAFTSANADTLFPTASMVKVSILCGVMDKIEKRELQYNQKLVYNDSLLYKGEDILGSFKNGDTIQLSKVTMLMITMSDNTASLWLQRLVGTPYINNWLNQNGFKSYRDNSRDPARQEWRAKYGWGVSTPYEMCRIFQMIRERRAISPAASERMYRTLNRIYWDDKALSEIPPYVQCISKQGAVDQAKSETVLVNAPHGDYVFSVMTNNIKDRRWTDDNETAVMIRKISALLWHYYEPKDTWKPAVGMGKFMKNE